MLTPIVCFTCGLPVGDMEDVFTYMREELVKKSLEKRGINPTQSSVDSEYQANCDEILTELCIPNGCCRKTLLCAMKFNDYY